MSMFIKMLEPEFPLWQRVIALEAVKIFSENEMLLFFFFKEYDENPGKPNKIFGSIAHSLGRFVHQSSIDISLCSSLIWNFQSHRSRGLDLLQETSPPLYDEAYCVAIAVQSVVNIVNCISSLTGSSLKSSILGQVSSGLLSPRTHVPDPPNYEIIRKMIHVTWAPVLTTLSSIIHKSTEVAQVSQNKCISCLI